MVAYLYRIPAGIAGSYNRVGAGNTTEAGLLLAANPPTAYGQAVATDPVSGRFRAPTTGDTAASIVGVLVRPYPSGSLGGATDGFGPVQPSVTGIQNIMRRGYVMVTVGGTAAATKNGTVYVRISAPAAGKPLGGFEAAADGANTVALPPTWYFQGPADAQGNGEIAVNT